MFGANNPLSLIYPVRYAGEVKDFHPDAKGPLLKKDFSELNYPEPVFSQSVDYLKFDRLVTEIAKDLVARRPNLPPWDERFPIVEPPPLPEAHMSRPPL
jgi:hypothetical protein